VRLMRFTATKRQQFSLGYRLFLTAA
jgi:hypothetical protein